MEVPAKQFQLKAIKQSKSEAVFLIAFPQEVKFIARQAKQLGLDVYFVGPDTLDSSMVFDNLNLLKYEYAYPTQSPDPKRKFAKLFLDHHNLNKKHSSFEIFGYDSIHFMIAAMRSGKTILNGIQSIKNLELISSKLSVIDNKIVKSYSIAKMQKDDKGLIKKHIITIYP